MNFASHTDDNTPYVSASGIDNGIKSLDKDSAKLADQMKAIRGKSHIFQVVKTNEITRDKKNY